MTLLELSVEYRAHARALDFRICQLQAVLERMYPGLCRDLDLRTERFNQHMTAGSLLVEVGTHGNTLQEALNGARLFARAAGQVLLGLED